MSEELLEIRDADAAFERIEEWLSARGFFAPGGEDIVADVYLGYGLSRALRRSAAPVPPEPCPALPFAACRAASARSLAADCYKAARHDRRLGADVDGLGVPRRDRRGTRRDRTGRRVPGQPRPASSGFLRRRSPCARCATRFAAAAPRRSLRHRRVGGRLRLARALSLATRRPDPDDADQGNPAAGGCGRAAYVREGRRRARDDRRPRAERPLPCLRAGNRALAGADGDAGARGRRAHGVDGRGNSASGSRARRDPPRDLSGRIRDGRAEDRSRGSHRRARAGRSRRVNGGDRTGLRQRRLRPRPHHPHVRGRRRRDPPLGGWRHRVGLRSGRRGRGVVDEGEASARGDRVARSRGASYDHARLWLTVAGETMFPACPSSEDVGPPGSPPLPAHGRRPAHDRARAA